MANNLAADTKQSIIHLLVEGNSIRSTERLTGVHRDTIMRLLVKTGNACREFLDERMNGLKLEHCQVDEIWSFVLKKNGRIPVEERENAVTIGDQYIFVAIDEATKLVPTFAIGKRTADMARRFMVDLAGRITLPSAHDTDAHAYQPQRYRPVTRISTDAWPGYPEAVDLAFGAHVQYGQLVKDYRNNDQPGRYAPPEMVNADRRIVFGDFDKRSICTSHVERNNLTMRTFLRRLTRLSLGFSKKLDNLAAALSLHFAHYDFCRRHSTLRMTPAMAAGVTNTLWSLEQLLGEVRA